MAAIAARSLWQLKDRLLCERRARVVLCLALTAGCGAVVGFLVEHRHAVLLYYGLVQNALYYLLPLAVLMLSQAELRVVLVSGVVVSLFTVALQWVLLEVGNADLIRELYPYCQNERVSCLLEMHLAAGTNPRLLPKGALLIGIVASGILFRGLVARRFLAAAGWSCTYLVFVAFLLYSGTRAFVVAGAAAWLFAWRFLRQARLLKPTSACVSCGVLLAGLAVLASGGGLATLAERSDFLEELAGEDTGVRTRIVETWDAVHLLVHNPFGIGLPRPPQGFSTMETEMWDVHGLLMLGLLGGWPSLVAAVAFFRQLWRSYQTSGSSAQSGACATALVYGITLLAINSTPVLTYPHHIIPFLLCSGWMMASASPAPLEEKRHDRFAVWPRLRPTLRWSCGQKELTRVHPVSPRRPERQAARVQCTE